MRAVRKVRAMQTIKTMRTSKRLDRYIDALNNERKPVEHEGRLYNDDFNRLTETVRRVKALKGVCYPDKEFEDKLIENVSASVALGRDTKGVYTGDKADRHAQADGKRTETGDRTARLQAAGARTYRGSRDGSFGQASGARALKRTIAVTAAVAAAVLLIFSATAIFSNKESQSIAYAMEKAIEGLKAYHGIIEYVEINELGETIIQSKREVWADRKGNYYVKELEGSGKGNITVNNGLLKWQLRQQEQSVYIFESFPDPFRFSFELGNELKDLKRAISVKEIGEEQVSGRDVSVLEITPDAGKPYRLWIDKESKLPLQRESAMHNALMYRVSYVNIEYADEIPAELLSYELPDGYAEINSNPEILLAGLKEAEEITGIQAIMPERIPGGYTLDKIAVAKNTPAIKLYYNKEEMHLIISQAPVRGELKPGLGSVIGRVGDSKAEIIDDGQLRSVRWQQDGMEFTVLGNDDMELIKGFVLSLADKELILPERKAENEETRKGQQTGNENAGKEQTGKDEVGKEQSGNGQAGKEQIGKDEVGKEQSGNGQAGKEQTGNEQAGSEQAANRPQIKLELDMEALENEQKSVDAGHSPWRLDPVYVAQVFASLLLSPEGISGDYPIAYEDIELLENNGLEAVAYIHDEKSIARLVYLKRPVRQDESGIWAVVGYDTDESR